MGDPFSVAGTAVGIISLGLQTCQILSKYCSDFKSFPRDVETIQRQIKGLQGILQGLYEVKERLQIDNHAPSSQLQMALKECEETLHELNKMAEKRNPASQSAGIQTKTRVMKERALWFYNKEDLKEVQSSLTRFQNNLSLALQCAGLDSAFRRLEELRSDLGFQRQQAVNIERTLNQGAEVLEMVRRDVASQNPTLSAMYSEIVSLRTQLSEGNASLRIDSYSLVGRIDISGCKQTSTNTGIDRRQFVFSRFNSRNRSNHWLHTRRKPWPFTKACTSAVWHWHKTILFVLLSLKKKTHVRLQRMVQGHDR